MPSPRSEGGSSNLNKEGDTAPYGQEVAIDVARKGDEGIASEEAGCVSAFTLHFVGDILRKADKKKLALDDVDQLPSYCRSNEQTEKFDEAWRAEMQLINKDTFMKVVGDLEKGDPQKKIFSCKSAWASLRQKAEEGQYRSYKDLQRFQEDALEIFNKHYRALSPNCIRCRVEMCPLPEGLPDVPQMPPVSKEHAPLLEVGRAYKRIIRRSQPDLAYCLFRLYSRDFLVGALWGLCQNIGVFTPLVLFPLIIDVLVKETEPLWHMGVYAGATFVAVCLMAFCLAQTYMTAVKLAIKLRGCLGASILKKALSISQAGWISAGGHSKVFTLLHSDTERVFQSSFSLLAYALYIPCQGAVAVGYLLYIISWPVLVGLVVVMVFMVYNASLANSFIAVFVQRMLKADGRTKKLHEMIENIRGVKFYGWEEKYLEEIMKFRLEECSIIRTLLEVIAKMLATANLAPFIFQIVTLAVYAAWDEAGLTSEKVYLSLGLSHLLRLVFTIIPFMNSGWGQTRVGLARVQEFLCREETDGRRTEKQVELDGRVTISGGEFGWERGNKAPVITNVNLEVKSGELVMIVGKVGSGKSTLISSILGEVTLSAGEVHIGGRVAYCPQSPWIFSGSIRENIEWAGNKNIDDREKLYHKCIRSVALLPDLKTQLVDGDATLIGEKGINISGGQKARVALARALYADADIYLLDDVLSAVDAHVGKHIFHNALEKQLAGKTRILVTNQLQFLQYADKVYSFEPNMEGSGHQLVEVDPNVPVEELEEGSCFRELMNEFQRQQNLSAAARQEEVDKEVSTVSAATTSGEDPNKQAYKAKTEGGHSLQTVEQIEEGAVSTKTFWTYYSYFGGRSWWAVIIFGHIFCNILDKFSQIWIGWYADRNTSDQTILWDKGEVITGGSTYFWMGVYTALILVVSIALGLREWMFASGAARPCEHIYRDELRGILYSPVSFFDTTPVGRILTRFVNDWEMIDFQVPLYTGQYFYQGGLIIASLLLLTLIVPFFVGIYIPLGLALWWLVRQDTGSLQMRRLFNVTKSPVSNIFAENLRGLATIRAYGLYDFVEHNQKEALDVNHSCFLQERFCFEWIRLRVTILAGSIMAFILLALILVRNTLTESALGLMVSQGVFLIITVTHIFLHRQQMDLAMNSVERVLEFCQLTKEEPDEVAAKCLKPPANWPAMANMDIQNLSVRYRPGLPLAIRDLNIRIEHGWKVGIVGRTGSGKSTILKVLFRLMQPESGFSLVIDGVDATRLRMVDLRKLFAIIPQEPVMFAGSVRKNVDPFGAYSDEVIRDAIEKCHLVPALKERAGPNGDVLDVDMKDESLSIGQRQMLCLARALVMKRKFLLLDEATASVDVHTDKLIQETLITAFQDCTVLTIAHRLNTITHSDRILVMTSTDGIGHLSQYGSYGELLEDQDGIFYTLAKEAKLID